jgi:maltose alpha-D-glucosyltransferase / alpha-amylase
MDLATLAVDGKWEDVLSTQGKTRLEEVLPAFLRTRRWFGGKARRIRSVDIADTVRIAYDAQSAFLLFADVSYSEGAPETYTLPLTFVSAAGSPETTIARVTTRGGEGMLVTPLGDRSFCGALLDAIGSGKTLKSSSGGEVRGVPARAFSRLAGRNADRLAPSLMRAEQSNSSILYGGRLILKIFRRLDAGINPDLEVGGFLTDAGFPHIPPVAGALEYRRGAREPITLGILQGFIRSEGDAWTFTLDALSRYYARVAAQAGELQKLPDQGLWETVREGPCPEARNLVGGYLEAAGLLGRRTAELHLALASGRENPAFAPEPFSSSYQASLEKSMRSLATATFQLLGGRLPTLPETLQAEARRVQALKTRVLGQFRSVLGRKITALRTRVHGDYHLGQVLYTGSDFVIIDFEGEPARPISERRIKRSPLRDVAGMLRSFHYAAYGALMGRRTATDLDIAALEPWANRWCVTVSALFLKTYLDVASHAPFLPQAREDLRALLETYQLEKAIYEMAYELNNRPDWVGIPMRGILAMLAGQHQ